MGSPCSTAILAPGFRNGGASPHFMSAGASAMCPPSPAVACLAVAWVVAFVVVVVVLVDVELGCATNETARTTKTAIANSTDLFIRPPWLKGQRDRTFRLKRLRYRRSGEPVVT